jgi:23S rRNA pseudouridine2604 synthase
MCFGGMMEPVRINKYLSEVGYCSRREGDKLIAERRVTINDKIPELGTKVQEGDVVEVDGKSVSQHTNPPIYLMYNKPIGITCTTDVRIEGNIIDAVDHPKRVFPIGRLDKPSEGLILLTDDGDIVNKILRARNHHDKEYIVRVDKPITEKFLQSMRSGVPILDTVTRPCVVQKIKKDVFRIILTQGLNRQIRRMCRYLSYNVRALKRVRIMNLKLDIPIGVWRDLKPSELSTLNHLLSGSQKIHEEPANEKSVEQRSSKRRGDRRKSTAATRGKRKNPNRRWLDKKKPSR